MSNNIEMISTVPVPIFSIPPPIPTIRFFSFPKRKYDDYIITAAFDSFGYMISKKVTHFNRDSGFRIARVLERVNSYNKWKEITWNEAIKLIDLKGRKIVADKLGLQLPPTIIISEELKDKVIKNLIKRRATNGDSGYKIMAKHLEIYETLAENGIIRTLDGKHFWIEN